MIPCSNCISLPICKPVFNQSMKNQTDYINKRHPRTGTPPLYSSLAKLCNRCSLIKKYVMEDGGGGMRYIHSLRGRNVHDYLLGKTENDKRDI